MRSPVVRSAGILALAASIAQRALRDANAFSRAEVAS